MKKLLICLILVGIFVLNSSSSNFLQAKESLGNEISFQEMLSLIYQNFPFLVIGQTLFVTTGKYRLFSLEKYLSVVPSTLPECSFKGVLVVLGEIHQKIDTLAAVGIAMGVKGKPYDWFMIVLTEDKIFYGFHPISKEVWKVKPQDIAMLLI
jgi:hypothetical protein